MIFADTSFWAALQNDRDGRHLEAQELFRARAREPVVTSNHVREETWTFLRARAGHRDAVAFVDSLAGSARVRVVHVSPEQEERALGWLRSHDERPYSFVDASSFVVMTDLRIREALAFGRDFEAAGFTLVRA